MSDDEFIVRLTQNSELKGVGVYNWSIPAFTAQVGGRTVVTCPSAGICSDVCYARNGTYRFRAVKAAHTRNLEMVLTDLPRWTAAMKAEVAKPKYAGRWVRIHDAGDFFSDPYLEAWLDIARSTPAVTFYAYTKEVARFRRHVFPENLLYLFSMGGLQDASIDPDVDRHSEVFASRADLEAAGYFDQEDDDRQAVTAPTTRIGIVSNNIPQFNHKLDGRTFGEAQRDADRASRTRRRIPPRNPTLFETEKP